MATDIDGAAGSRAGAGVAVAAISRPLCTCGRPGRRSDRGRGSLSVDSAIVRQPDLAIYSQAERLARNAEPTWNNPDIATFDFRTLQMRSDVEVTVRNISDVAAVNALVHYHTSRFGIGMPRRRHQSRIVSLDGGDSIILSFPLQDSLPSDSTRGICVEIEHPHDANPANNSGYAMVHLVSFAGGGSNRAVELPVCNNSGESRQIEVSIMPSEVLAFVGFAEAAPGVPNHYESGQTKLFQVTIQAPDVGTGADGNPVMKPLTFIARDARTGALIGGATFLLVIGRLE